MSGYVVKPRAPSSVDNASIPGFGCQSGARGGFDAFMALIHEAHHFRMGENVEIAAADALYNHFTRLVRFDVRDYRVSEMFGIFELDIFEMPHAHFRRPVA